MGNDELRDQDGLNMIKEQKKLDLKCLLSLCKTGAGVSTIFIFASA
jgi:hypothetical protein